MNCIYEVQREEFNTITVHIYLGEGVLVESRLNGWYVQPNEKHEGKFVDIFIYHNRNHEIIENINEVEELIKNSSLFFNSFAYKEDIENIYRMKEDFISYIKEEAYSRSR